MGVVLVTGCRSGFGLLIAVSAARAGHVVYAGLRDLSTAGELEKASEGLEVIPVALDVTSKSERDAVVKRMLDERGRIDGLVNNAGIALGGFLEQVDEDELRRVMEVNVFGLWALTQACLPAMRDQGSGHIINISSVAGLMALPGLGAYAASKFALEGMSEGWRHELKPFGISVCLVEPGPYKTDILTRNRSMARRTGEAGSPYLAQEARSEQLFDKVVAGGTGDPQDVADRVVSLLAQRSPALRHLMGNSAKVRVTMKRVLPFAVLEFIVGRLTKT